MAFATCVKCLNNTECTCITNKMHRYINNKKNFNVMENKQPFTVAISPLYHDIQ